MPQQCPHCMTEIHEHASTCLACGAIRGVWGRSVESWRQTSTFLLGFAAVIFVLGVALWTWIASDYSATWFGGMIGFLLLSPFMLFFASIGLVMRYAIPRMVVLDGFSTRSRSNPAPILVRAPRPVWRERATFCCIGTR